MTLGRGADPLQKSPRQKFDLTHLEPSRSSERRQTDPALLTKRPTAKFQRNRRPQDVPRARAVGPAPSTVRESR